MKSKTNTLKFFLYIALFIPLIGCSNQEVKIDIEESNAHYQLGIEFARYKLLDNAVEEFLLAVKYNPGNYKAHSKLGLVYFNTGKSDRAEKEWQKTISLNPNYTKAYLNLGTLNYVSKKNKEKALEFWEKVLSISPRDADALNNIGNYYKDANELDKAVRYYTRAAEAKPNSTLILNNIANAYLSKGETEKAEELLLKSKGIDADNPMTNFLLGKYHSQKKELDKAIEAYNNVVLSSPRFSESYYELASIYFNDKKDLSRADSMIKKAVGLNPAEKKYVELLKLIKAKL